ncbi:NAD(P)/FAD-dependent oxidoreductase [Goodfellowiella coeruleoviolacea]|uniref:Thioredoxin reductase n=1 Tax=Goodfellowiella coeruleoviolacea TaxID=334858 RepID=A0AAE3GA61_9PSEU|nr:FAD/NAD(P)-binding oxidoreductase [Goodfellowiella coeruleoviolacea]MCP2164507.1 Thioredoxin reductase [Goodfellowiella coeruleoviolacea]
MARLIAVVGAGPAGMAAALAAADAGAEVVLVDAAPRVGGQYHRQPPPGLADQHAGPGFARLEAELAGHPRVRHLAETVVWALEPRPGGHRLHLRTGPADSPHRTARVLDPAALVLATGAHDRALPFPGWDLPGVVTAGAAQALAKGQRVAVGRRVLLAGTGPFLFPVAQSLIEVGAHLVGVLEANRVGATAAGWLARPAALLAGRAKLPELAGYLGLLARHRIAYRTGHAVLAAHGTDRVEAVTTARLTRDWRVVPGSARRIAVDAVCVGFGFTPQLELAVAAGCDLDATGTCVRVDIAQATSTPGVFAAGELTGVGGADLAAAEGRVAGASAARHLGLAVPVPRAALRQVRAGRGFAAALAGAYPVRPGWRSWLTEDTLVCRCEEVSYGALCQAVRQRAALGGRVLRLTSRVGLGPCQGRICGRNAAELAEALLCRADQRPPLTPAASARRPIAAPIRLGELATTPTEPSEHGFASTDPTDRSEA